MEIFMEIFVFIVILYIVLLSYVQDFNKKKVDVLNEQIEVINSDNDVKDLHIEKLEAKIAILDKSNKKCSHQLSRLKEAHSKYVFDTNALKKYLPIADIEKEISRLRIKSEQDIKTATLLAHEIKQEALRNAENIAGNALDAKKNAYKYQETAKAMNNIINGYGNEYLIPNKSLLDDLASEYSHKDSGIELAKQRKIIKKMIKDKEAAKCDYADPKRRDTAINFVLDAYNGKVDTVMTKVKHDNYGKLLEQLNDIFSIINHNGQAFRDARITYNYHNEIIKQLKLAVSTSELKKIDIEEQRQIREQMREEKKVEEEYNKAKKEVEREEKMLQKAMEKAKKQFNIANDDEKLLLREQLAKLQLELIEVEKKGERAMSMAQKTRAGHVYVISNIGSFGNDIFKIGMTRRLDPLDRVKELGDASVPFPFDVHAMIQSDDAPTLEKKIHRLFEGNQVNKINHRKEFFKVSINKIKEVVEKEGYNIHWTMKAEALDFYESKSIEQSVKRRLLQKL